MNISGIYKIQSILKPERIYIGSAVNINYRWLRHLFDLRNNKHHSKKLQRHFDKYGESDLQFSILLSCEKSELIDNEQFFIDCYNPYFNNRPNAANQLGFKHSDKTKIKISKAKKGSDYWTGRKHKEESKIKMRKARLGTHPSDETRGKLKKVKLDNKNATGNKNRLGIGFTDESKKKISEGLKRYFAKKREERLITTIKQIA